MRTIRNVFKRKLRAFLTIFGITIGVLALVVMGAMAEKLNLLVDGGVEYYQDKVIISDGTVTGGLATAPMSTDKLAEIEKVDGVVAASASIMLPLDEEPSGVNMGTMPLISGEDGRGREYEEFEIRYADGREMKVGEAGVCVVGADLVKKLDAKVGERIDIRGESFEVVGIMEKTLTAPDTAVSISLADAQRLFAQSLPEAVRANVNQRELCTAVAAYAEDGVDPDKLAEKIGREVPGLTTMGPGDFEEQIVQTMAMLNSIIFGIAIISLLVGGLSVINTMTMSVAERTREIGIRKAIGASNGAIMRQFVAESAIIGVVGGAVGLGLGWLIASALNVAGEASANALFLVTTRLAVGSVVFAVVLGVIAGLWPAWHASRLNPVQALRYE